MKKQPFILLVLMLCLVVSSCGRNNGSGSGDDLEGKYVIPANTSSTVIFAESVDGIEIPIFISIPVSAGHDHVGMVLMHGSGGPWKDSDTNGDGIADEVEEWSLSSQNSAWKILFDDESVISAFPGSYYRRGTVENEGEWKDPPLQFQISATFVRNYDAMLTLKVLRNLVWEDGTPIVSEQNIGLLGFSHGGTAVQSSIFDIDAVTAGWKWSQSFDGVTYTEEMRPPAALPEEGGFKAAVMYYPGSFHNGYYGNPCNETSIYRATVDFAIHLPSEDGLTANSNCMLQTVIRNGGGSPTVFNYEGADHGFDNKSSGFDGDASVVARERTMLFLKSRLGF